MAVTSLLVDFSYNVVVPCVNVFLAAKEQRMENWNIGVKDFGDVQLVTDFYEIIVLVFNL